MHMLLYAFIVDILYVRTVLGLDLERHYQVDLIDGLHLINSTYEGLSTVPGLHPFSPCVLLAGDARQVRLEGDVFARVARLLREQREGFTLLATVRQDERNAGTILAFSRGNDRFLELQSSGRKDEIRLHYSHRGSVYVETFPYRLADGQWHRLALTVSGTHATLLVDCSRIYERRIRTVDTDLLLAAADNNNSSSNRSVTTASNASGSSNLSLWLGQRNDKHFLFKGSLQDVKIVAREHGYLTQCPHLDTECPTCGQFRQLQMSVTSLESHIWELTKRLADAEKRIADVEECDCRRSCDVNGSVHTDGATWRQDCDICSCAKGEVRCHPIQCPPSPCKNPVTTPGDCCPTCLKQCLLRGVLYDHGEEVSIRQCTDCACHDGNMRCRHLDRAVVCPKLTCPEHEQFNVSEECCPFCPGVDYCAKGHRCHPNATCANLRTRYECQCNRGFQGDGKHCEDVNECLVRGGHDGHYCHANTLCVNVVGGYLCECVSGYVRVDLYNCAERDECASGEHRCDAKHARCVNTDGSYTCECLPGYEGDGFHCQPKCNHSCVNGGRCLAPGICACRRGYIGPSCNIDVDECSLGIHQCRPNSRCVNMAGWYRCECLPGFHSQSEDNTLGILCQDLDECALGFHTCHPSSQCVNTEGSFQCECYNSSSLCSSDCTYESQVRQNGSQWRPADEACTLCTCINGVVKCERSLCNCTHPDVDLTCCPQCDRSSSCSHQELATAMQNGEQWLYQCQICECLYGEMDCWPMECPPPTCDNPMRTEGDCCPRCEDDPCSMDAGNDSASSALSVRAEERGCTYSGHTYGSRKFWNALHDPCTTCQCKDGHICCSYNSNCNGSHSADVMMTPSTSAGKGDVAMTTRKTTTTVGDEADISATTRDEVTTTRVEQTTSKP